MEALREKGCDFIVEAMKNPQVVSQSGYSMQELVSGCKQVCPNHACSSTEKDGAFDQFTFTYESITVISSPFKMMPSMLILLVIFIIQKLF